MSSLPAFLDEVLSSVKRPIQYLGQELNVVRKDPGVGGIRIALVYPDKYEVAMSNLAVQLFYDRINRHSPHVLERVIIPDEDMIDALRLKSISLFSLETQRALKDFDLIAFSVSTELALTNVLLALDLASIPLRSSDRDESFPLVIAGGGGVMNPLPMSLFMDAIVIGDGEEALVEVADLVSASATKALSLAALDKKPWAFVPTLHDRKRTLSRAVFSGFKEDTLLIKPLVPLMKVVHDRYSLEIMRGCPRKCRFCQASYTSKPIRQKSAAGLIEQGKAIIEKTGAGELSLASLSSSDYQGLIELIHGLQTLCEEKQVALSLPSLRMDSLTSDMNLLINRLRESGITLAPEAGSQFLRDVIAKDLTLKDIVDAVKLASTNSHKSIKLYFMIGLPRETMADVDAICDLAFHLIEEIKPKKNKIVINVSSFNPKPYTPFQWCAQDDRAILDEKLNLLKKGTRHRQLELRWTDPELTWLEGLLSRGDERVGDVIERAFRKGACFDAWYDHFQPSRWFEAMEEAGLPENEYQKARDLEDPLPWGFVDMGIRLSVVKDEYERAMKVVRTEETSLDAEG
jgi:radical SAM superfamily enzyme YgiQ (UPF0313 family)